MNTTARGAIALVCASFVVALLLPARDAVAAVPPEGDRVERRVTGHRDLFVRAVHLSLDQLPDELNRKLRDDLSALSVEGEAGGYDVRAGRWGSLITATPLVPGPGVGNTLGWAAAPPADAAAYKEAVWQAFTAWLETHEAELGVDVAELAPPTIGAHEGNRLVHVHAGRVHEGIPVRDSFVKATLNSGNLVLYVARNWGAIDVAATPGLSADDARGLVARHLKGLTVAHFGEPALVILPMASGATATAAVGRGYTYRLAWAIAARVDGSQGSWEALVDAHSGELLSFHDTNSYFDQKKIVGGVLPVSNDGQSPGGVPDGFEQPGYPMSRAYVFQGTTRIQANSEGLVTASGAYRTSLTGPFVRIQDGCGAVNETTTCDALDLGIGQGTDCARPDGHSLGDTRSARTGFYELNRLIDQAKTWLGPEATANTPAGWLNRQLPANMNINNACNAFFSPTDTAAVSTGSINFYRQGALGSNTCRNTGEIAAVFDHEWGHGLDTFDDSPGVSLPGEFYADAAAIARLNTSCIGRGFYLNNVIGGRCTGNGDPCTECTGVREDDWMKRESRMPHDLAWVLDQNPTVPGNCGAVLVPATPFNSGPCQRGTHCEGTILGEAFWDLLKRDLPCHTRGWEAPFPGGNGPIAGGRCRGANAAPTMDADTALVLGTRLYYLAAGGVALGYQCDQAPGTGAARNGGCNADSWYMSFLAADDDDGTFANGTPHMLAINDAFRRHGLACRAPAPLNGGCLATPAPPAKPVVTGSAGPRSASIAWSAVPGAAEYWILRTDGIHGCNFGKTRMARIAATAPRTFAQGDLLDGLTYYYSVLPVGGLVPAGIGADACAGPMSDCAAITPLPPSGTPGACQAPANQPPTAVDDAISVPRNHPNTVAVAGNDTDPDNDALVVTSVSAPAFGQAVLNPDSRVTYTPPAGFEGVDTFDYVISDGRGGSDTGRVTLTVAGDPCAEGFTVLTDPVGDASTGPGHDVRSAAIAQTADGKLVFILKMTSLASVPQATTWPISYTGADGAVRFVRMNTANVLPTNPPAFAHGNGATVTPYTAPGTPADPGSSFSADGTIRIVVSGSAIGNPQVGQKLTAFLSRIRIESPDGSALTPDNMPDSLVAGGSYEVVGCPQ